MDIASIIEQQPSNRFLYFAKPDAIACKDKVTIDIVRNGFNGRNSKNSCMSDLTDHISGFNFPCPRKKGYQNDVEETRKPLSDKALISESNSRMNNSIGRKYGNEISTGLHTRGNGKYTNFSIEDIFGNKFRTKNEKCVSEASLPKKVIKDNQNYRVNKAAHAPSKKPSTAIAGNQSCMEGSKKHEGLQYTTEAESNSKNQTSPEDFIVTSYQENRYQETVTKKYVRTNILSSAKFDAEKDVFRCRISTKRKRKVDQDERRRIANERERSRVHTLAAAFDALRDAIPSFSPTQKLSKLTILKVAINYINALDSLASSNAPPGQKQDFADSVDACTQALKAEYGRAKRLAWQEKR